MYLSRMVVAYFGSGSRSIDLEELDSWIKGEVESMPLSDAERARLEEIEEIRARVQQKVMREARPMMGGPIVGNCAGCGHELQANWRFCPSCGLGSTASCQRCRFPIPEGDDIKFCPQCGGRLP